MNSNSQSFAPANRPMALAAWALVGLWLAAMSALSSIPFPAAPPDLRLLPFDKAAHLSAFATGALLIWHALRLSTDWPTVAVTLATLTAACCYGVYDEFHQLLTPGRSGADPGDWLADATGAILGASFCLFLHAARHFLLRPHRATADPARGRSPRR